LLFDNARPAHEGYRKYSPVPLEEALWERRIMCHYCSEAVDTSQTYVVQENKLVHLVCWITVYWCQLEDVLREIRKRERR